MKFVNIRGERLRTATKPPYNPQIEMLRGDQDKNYIHVIDNIYTLKGQYRVYVYFKVCLQKVRNEGAEQ